AARPARQSRGHLPTAPLEECASMVQAKWAETLVAGLLCAGIALGQFSTNGSNADLAPNSVVTFRETGKSDRKCKVVRRWRDDTGRWAYELEMLDSHERQVIYEPEPVS